jgi:hypothetical protein
MYKIQSGKPSGDSPMYPFASMKVNTYFRIPAGDIGAKKAPGATVPRVSSSAYAFAKRNKVKLAVRRMKNGDVKIFRTA